MSRLLGYKARKRRLCKHPGAEGVGWAMFERGEPCPHFVPVRGVGRIEGQWRAVWRGWMRAAAAARTKAARRGR